MIWKILRQSQFEFANLCKSIEDQFVLDWGESLWVTDLSSGDRLFLECSGGCDNGGE